jgi:hypothetical protein
MEKLSEKHYSETTGDSGIAFPCPEPSDIQLPTTSSTAVDALACATDSSCAARLVQRHFVVIFFFLSSHIYPASRLLDLTASSQHDSS